MKVSFIFILILNFNGKEWIDSNVISEYKISKIKNQLYYRFNTDIMKNFKNLMQKFNKIKKNYKNIHDSLRSKKSHHVVLKNLLYYIHKQEINLKYNYNEIYLLASKLEKMVVTSTSFWGVFLDFNKIKPRHNYFKNKIWILLSENLKYNFTEMVTNLKYYLKHLQFLIKVLKKNEDIILTKNSTPILKRDILNLIKNTNDYLKMITNNIEELKNNKVDTVKFTKLRGSYNYEKFYTMINISSNLKFNLILLIILIFQ